jgi:hypothetical protein
LRRAPGKERLTVIDFVGNHKVFLRRLGALRDNAGWVPGREGLADWLQMAARSATSAELPPGCSVQVALEAVRLLEKLLAKQAKLAPKQIVEEFVLDYGRRPTAIEFYHRGGLPKATGAGGWFEFLRQQEQLSPQEAVVADELSVFLTEVGKTAMDKCFKLVVLSVLAEGGGLRDGVDLAELSQRSLAWLRRRPELLFDIEAVKELGDPATMEAVRWPRYWRTNPVGAWLGESSKTKPPHPHFRVDGNRLVLNHNMGGADVAVLSDMLTELVEWRLDEYRRRPKQSEHLAGQIGAFDCKVIQTAGKPILKLLGSEPHPVAKNLLQVRVPGGEEWTFDFQKIACNVARPQGSRLDNQLPVLMRRLFGEHAGQPGTNFRLRFEHDAGGWRAVVVGQADAQVLPFAPRVRVRALPSLRVAAGWATESHTDDALEEFEEVELPGPIPEGCVAVRASGSSMAGWRSEIRDGDWLIVRPLSGAGFAAVEGQIAVVARGDAEGRTYHCKRVVRDDAAKWWLRSDSVDVGALAVGEGDEVVAEVRKVIRPEDVAPPLGAQLASIAEAFGVSREPEGKIDRVDGWLFVVVDGLDRPDRVAVQVANRRPGERAFVVAGPAGGQQCFVGVGSWDDEVGAWRIPEVDFETWRRHGQGRSASRELPVAHTKAAGEVVEALMQSPGPGGWVTAPGKRFRIIGLAAQGGLRIDGGEGGFAERTVSLTDIGWVLVAKELAEAEGLGLDEALVNRVRYLDGTPQASTRWIDSGWALVAVANAAGVG